MATDSAAGSSGGNGGAKLEKRVTAVEHGLGIIAGVRDELHAGLAALRDQLRDESAAASEFASRAPRFRSRPSSGSWRSPA